ncbi:DUF6864 domain-containing function [Shewanella oncorhynchi]|uniref:DUF6864 domain-containing function n=1 Tax=Shewanella TaxID=22 RepID=UPI0039874F16
MTFLQRTFTSLVHAHAGRTQVNPGDVYDAPDLGVRITTLKSGNVTLLQHSEYPLKITTSGYEVIASGVVHLTAPEVKFSLANLVIKYQFKNSSEDSRFIAEVIDNELVISLYNFNNSLGQGRIEPIEIGTLGGKRLFATWFVNTPTGSGDIRQFCYTFMLMGA